MTPQRPFSGVQPIVNRSFSPLRALEARLLRENGNPLLGSFNWRHGMQDRAQRRDVAPTLGQSRKPTPGSEPLLRHRAIGIPLFVRVDIKTRTVRGRDTSVRLASPSFSHLFFDATTLPPQLRILPRGEGQLTQASLRSQHCQIGDSGVVCWSQSRQLNSSMPDSSPRTANLARTKQPCRQIYACSRRSTGSARVPLLVDYLISN